MAYADALRNKRNQLLREARAAAKQGDIERTQHLTHQANAYYPITGAQYRRLLELAVFHCGENREALA